MTSGKLKQVLIVYYTQTGQQKEILDNLLAPLLADRSVALTWHRITPVQDYAFPWTKARFFDVFPESFRQTPCPLQPVPESIMTGSYDLVIFGYQIWYLSPSIPANAFLMSEEGRQLLARKPVITVIGCRNMWVMAQEKVKRLLKNAGAQLVGHIVLADRHINHVSLITIVHWMMKGKKDAYLGIFPKPGVSDKDIREASRLGTPVLTHLHSGDYTGLQDTLISLRAVTVKPLLVFIEKRGSAIFARLSALIHKKGSPGSPQRSPWLKLFNYYLLFALWIIAPIVSVLFMLLYLPLLPVIYKEKKYYKSIYYK